MNRGNASYHERTSLRRAVGIVLETCLGLWSIESVATTVYVAADGSGDAPTIMAAMEMAVGGESVVVGPGTHSIGSLFIKDGIVLRSEFGPVQTKLVPAGDASITCLNLHAWTEISGFWIDAIGGPYFMAGAINISACDNLHIVGNIFTNNDEAAIVIYGAGATFNYVLLEHNTFLGNDLAIWAQDAFYHYARYNIIWDPAEGAVGACNDVLNLEDVAGPNFSNDPLFCGGEGAAAYFLQPESPCAPESDPWGLACGLIGALPVNCPSTPVERETWGRTKARYRSP